MALVSSSYPVAMAEGTSNNTTSSTDSSAESQSTSLFSARSRRQLTLFFAGATFFVLSTVVTRRSLRRRYLAIVPHFYQPSNGPPRVPVNGALEAFEALNIATINVTSIMMMVTGGFLWAFDISTLEELRGKLRGGLGVDGSGRGETDIEEELEEWPAIVLESKKEKEEKRTKKDQSKDWRDQAREAFEEEREEMRTNERGKRR